jgi:hypothetical protein
MHRNRRPRQSWAFVACLAQGDRRASELVRHIFHAHKAHVAWRGESIAGIAQTGCLVIRPGALRAIAANDSGIGSIRLSIKRWSASLDLRGQAWRENKTCGNDRSRGYGVKRLDHGTSPVGNLAVFCGNASCCFWLRFPMILVSPRRGKGSLITITILLFLAIN